MKMDALGFCLPPSSDLALRNCLLTSDLTVRIGDYGLSHNHYKVLIMRWFSYFDMNLRVELYVITEYFSIL